MRILQKMQMSHLTDLIRYAMENSLLDDSGKS